MIPSRFLERDVLRNQIDDVDAVSDFLDPIFGNRTLQDPVSFFKTFHLI